MGRIERGDAAAWWSARPDGADALADATPAEQVTWQAHAVLDAARTELAHLPAEHSTHVTYDELCADPAGLVDRIHAWLAASGVELQRRPGAAVPSEFGRRGGGELAPELEQQLAVAVAAIGASDDAGDDDD